LDYNELLLAAQDGLPRRVNWCSGDVSNYDNVNNTNPAPIINSPMFKYTGNSLNVYTCPADLSAKGQIGNLRGTPRPRSISMSQVFGFGEWLDRNNNRGQTRWRKYAKDTDIVQPANTFVFVDEHPDSINDAAFANACTGADSPTQAQIIDFPASTHGGACGFSFADGHSEIRRWVGATIQQPIRYRNNAFPLNVPARDSWVDVQWMAQNTTVPL
jgi:prepilin-type processing-associated H-X9-DG protein